MAITTFSPTKKGFASSFFPWPRTRLNLDLISFRSRFSCFTYPSRSSKTATAGANDKSERRFGLRPNKISHAETPVCSYIILFIYSMIEGSRVLQSRPFLSNSMVRRILLRVLWLLSITALPCGQYGEANLILVPSICVRESHTRLVNSFPLSNKIDRGVAYRNKPLHTHTNTYSQFVLYDYAQG